MYTILTKLTVLATVAFAVTVPRVEGNRRVHQRKKHLRSERAKHSHGNRGPSMYAVTGASCWLTVKGPTTPPTAGSPCASVDVNALNAAATWTAANAYQVKFFEINAGKDCMVVANMKPNGFKSPDGKYYLGPYQIKGLQQYAVYDEKPAFENTWTVPSHYSSLVSTKDAKTDANTVIFSNGEWVKQGHQEAKNMVQEVAPVRQTNDLYYGDTICVDMPSSDDYSVLDMLTASDTSSLSLQRKQDTTQIWAVQDNCEDFNKAKVHMDCLKTAECQQYTTEQFGAPFPGHCTWQ